MGVFKKQLLPSSRCKLIVKPAKPKSAFFLLRIKPNSKIKIIQYKN